MQTDQQSPAPTGKTFILRIDHAVSDYDAWKAVFDSDPVGREKSGLRRYQISRVVGDPNHVLIDVEFDSSDKAEALLAGLRVAWTRVDGKVIFGPQARVVEAVETKEY